MENRFQNYLFLYFVLWSMSTMAQTESVISLAGEWQVKLDSLNIGANENWAMTGLSGVTIDLPGTLDDARIGKPNTLEPALNNYVLSNLTRKHQYIGKAWYQKEIEIPQDWEKKDIRLKLERVIWQSKVYVDGKLAGTSESLIGSHDYNLGELLPPGKHLLTIMIDNSNKYPFINVKGDRYPDLVNQDMAHAYTNHTQIKWNGIIGEISLRASEADAPKNLQIYPDFINNSLNVVFEQTKINKGMLIFEILDADGGKIYSEKIEKPLVENRVVNFSISKPELLESWDEFHPNVYTAKISNGNGYIEQKFGVRKLENREGVLTLNDSRIFLRGNLECAIFPLTGYPPTQKSDWAKLIDQAQNYGLNHLRFHSWCPPKAAFKAADEAGFYLQVELPHWSLEVGKDEQTTQFLRQEANKILRDYGNHPSFLFMALGNELQGDIELLNVMTAELKKKDDRHLYATTSFSFQKPTGTRPEPQDEFFIAQWTDKGWIRGQGIFNSQSPSFDTDYSANSEHIKIPLISHEIGQYSVYPDLTEIPKYKGVLEPLNFIAVKNDLEKKGMLNLADAFTQASGKLAAMLYKEEIERALKTPSFDGFQLLQLQDFPGQGTALVGLLNAFWESKGAISAKEFRKFNSPLVPLIRFEKAVYENGESFTATIEVANFLEDKEEQVIEWSITDEEGNILTSNTLKNIDLFIGNNLNLGKIQFPVQIEKAQRWTVQVKLKGTEFQNDWPIWVYPTSKVSEPKSIYVTTSFEEAISALDKGKKVLLNPDPKKLKGIQGRFVPVFWSPVHFPDQPGTMGLLIDEKHPALNEFPTKSHTEWQWWDLCINSKSVNTDNLNVEPVVRVIDNFVTNRKLANVFEAKVGTGKLLFTSIDLHSDLEKRPVARQLRKSLLDYMTSKSFDPKQIIKKEDLNGLRQ